MSVRPRIHSSFVAAKYGSGTRPVRSRIKSAGSCAHREAVRRSCHTMARWTGRPERRCQTSVVSRWFVLHPARLRKVLLERAVTAPDGAERLVDDETRRARRALVDRENHSRPKGNATSCGNRRRQEDGSGVVEYGVLWLVLLRVGFTCSFVTTACRIPTIEA